MSELAPPPSIPYRQPDGRRRSPRPRKPRHGNPGLVWRRVIDNIDAMVLKTGANPELGSVISRMVLFGHLTPIEGQAARRYGEVTGAYERFFGSPNLKRAAASPSWLRGFGGEDQELERHAFNGSMRDYEKAARKALKRWKQMDKSIGSVDHIRRVLDDLCCHDIEIPSTHYNGAARLLRALAIEFGLMGSGGSEKTHGGPPTPTTRDPSVVARGLCDFVVRLMKPIVPVKIEIADGPPVSNERAIIGISADGEFKEVRTNMKGLLAAALDAQIVKEAEARGWAVA